MIKISACVITKNEETNINQWLNNVRALADEIVVVDTGSADRTVELAKTGGARVYHFVWCDDFAAAKNFALEQATGEWIIFLDADEYFTANSLENVRRAIQRFHANRKILGLACRLFNLDKDRNNMVVNSILQIRIFRNLKALRYVGKVHEAIKYNANGSMRFQMLKDVKIYHTGYSSSIIQEKLRRNLQLVEAKILRQKEERPEDQHYLLDCYFGLGEYEKAIQYAEKFIASGIRLIGMEGEEYTKLVRSKFFLHHPKSEILCVLEEGIQKYPEFAELFFLRAFILWSEKDYLEVEKSALRGIEICKQQEETPKIGQVGTGTRLTANGYWYLGQIAQMKNRMQEAINYFLQALQLLPQDIEIFSSLYGCIKALPSADIIQFLNSCYDKDQDAVFLAEALRKNSAEKVYLYYASRRPDLYSKKDLYASYVAAGRYDAAAIQLAEELDSIYRLGIRGAARMGLAPQNTELALLLPELYMKQWQSFMVEDDSTDGRLSEEKVIQKAAEIFEEGNAEEAIELVRRAFAENTGNKILSYGLATFLHLTGADEEAYKILCQAKDLIPEAIALRKELENHAASLRIKE